MVVLTGAAAHLALLFLSCMLGFMTAQPCWSQVQQQSPSEDRAQGIAPIADLRVEQSSTICSGALRAKFSGGSSFNNYSPARKRAFRRARQRAMLHGQTMYRGRLHTASSLQGLGTPDRPRPRDPHRVAVETMGRERARVRAQTWNMGGCTAELYDVLCHWLRQQTTLDVLFLQEIHWGLGKAESQWSIDGWTFFVSPDPRNRYSGVAIVISHRLAGPQDTTFCEWMPGRLLQVRTELPGLNIDFLCVYQWVRDREPKDLNQERREQLWHNLGQALHSLPSRNLLLVAGDLNSGLSPRSCLIGRGLLSSTIRKADAALVELIETHQLCVLNTWGRARACQCATYINGSQTSQLDYFLVRRSAADAVARRSGPVTHDLAQWRHGPRHLRLQCNIPRIAGWVLQQRSQPLVLAYSKADLRWHLSRHTNEAQAFRARIERIVDNVAASVAVSSLNRRVLNVCRQFFPPPVV